jgi:uncharacterized caspase-like protein
MESQTNRYDEVVPMVLVDNEATVAAIKDKMGWLSDTVTPEDMTFVLLSSHGVYDQFNTWRFVTHDHAPDSRLDSTTLTYAELLLWFEDRLPSNAVLFVDACHAAGIGGAKPNEKAVSLRLRPSPWQGASRLIFASSEPDEKSRELDNHGAFTKAMLEAFAKPEMSESHSPDGYLDSTELAGYLKKRVPELTQGTQHPTVRDPGLASDPVIFQFVTRH